MAKITKKYALTCVCIFPEWPQFWPAEHHLSQPRPAESRHFCMAHSPSAEAGGSIGLVAATAAPSDELRMPSDHCSYLELGWFSRLVRRTAEK